jgi:hypothetical protein
MTQLQTATVGSRVCSDCKIDKPLDEFSVDRSRKLGREYICKPCRHIRNRKNKYGLSQDQYKEMVNSTPACPICGSEEPLVIDHDHSTSEVRGLICDSCNLGLGKFKDNIESLKNAIAYLENGPLSKATRSET